MLSKPKSLSSSSNEESSCFESAIVDNFRCSLCLNVLRNPVQCQRNEHHFCKSCIARHLKQSMVCPSCKEALSLETVRPASQILTKLLSQLKIHCDYSQRGCNLIMKVEELETHHKVCQFTPIVCSNKDCSEVVNRRDRANHENKACQFRLVKCSVCDESLVFRWYKMHSCVLRSDLEEVKSSVKTIEESVNQILKLIQPIDNYMFQGIKQNIIICGGSGSTSAEMYNWTTKTWARQKQPMKFTLEYGTSFVYKGELIVTGITGQGCSGRSDGMEALALGENFVESQWKSGQASLPYNCYAHATVLVGDRLFVFGGMQSSYLDGVYEVRLVSPFTCKLVSHMPEPRCYHGVGLFGDKVVIVGGQTKDGVSNEVLMYDLTKSKWKKLAPLDKPVMKMATVCWNENIIILGGQNTTSDSNPISEVLMYNVTAERSTTMPAMQQRRNRSAAVMTGNTIIVMGGNGTNSVEYLNLKFNSSWEALPVMKEARTGATAHVC